LEAVLALVLVLTAEIVIGTWFMVLRLVR